MARGGYRGGVRRYGEKEGARRKAGIAIGDGYQVSGMAMPDSFIRFHAAGAGSRSFS